MLNYRDPRFDERKLEVVDCERCEEPIYKGDTYCDFDGEIICEYCLLDWVDDHKKEA